MVLPRIILDSIICTLCPLLIIADLLLISLMGLTMVELNDQFNRHIANMYPLTVVKVLQQEQNMGFNRYYRRPNVLPSMSNLQFYI